MERTPCTGYRYGHRLHATRPPPRRLRGPREEGRGGSLLAARTSRIHCIFAGPRRQRECRSGPASTSGRIAPAPPEAPPASAPHRLPFGRARGRPAENCPRSLARLKLFSIFPFRAGIHDGRRSDLGPAVLVKVRSPWLLPMVAASHERLVPATDRTVEESEDDHVVSSGVAGRPGNCGVADLQKSSRSLTLTHSIGLAVSTIWPTSGPWDGLEYFRT